MNWTANAAIIQACQQYSTQKADQEKRKGKFSEGPFLFLKERYEIVNEINYFGCLKIRIK